MDWLVSCHFDRPDIVLLHAPRGSGKTFLSAFDTHLDSLEYENHETKILGGSEAQSKQLYAALKEFEHPFCQATYAATTAKYTTGSLVSYIPASAKSVRGPHVPSLRLDEVDEIETDIREAAMGMSMARNGIRAKASLTSTWHRVGGPMSDLIERGESGEFPVYRYCVWEVLERCPEARSGPNLELCGSCPLVAWCHADVRCGQDGRLYPKAKRSNGHYSIDSLIQKIKSVSLRVLKSDYFCDGPQAAGVWFREFSREANVSESAEYDPSLPVHCSVDSGVFTGAVLFQVRTDASANQSVSIFGELLAEGKPAEEVARSIGDLVSQRCGSAVNAMRVSTDSAGGAKNPVGPTVIAEYERAGLRGKSGIERWPRYPGSVQQQLALLESFVKSADGTVGLTIHPRCVRLIQAMEGYARAKRAGQWMDYPEDPQHPHEDMIDALRGGLAVEFPRARQPEPKFRRTSIRNVL